MTHAEIGWEGWALGDVMPSPVRVEVIGGFVNPVEQGRAHALVASVCRRAHRARGRVVLFAQTDAVGSETASADAILVLDEYRLLCAGAVGASVRDAIERLEARLHRQTAELGDREDALREIIHGQGKPSSSRHREPARA